MTKAIATSGQTSILQLSLWSVVDDAKTNMVALYDLAPRFVYRVKDSKEARQKVVEREFTFGSKRFRITLKPTQIQLDPDDKNSVVDRYLGEREQIVEEVIRRLASKRNRLRLHDNNKLRFIFSVYEVREELQRVNHTYSLDEIYEAITLLNEVRLRIEELGTKTSPLLSAAVFPVMGMRRQGDDGDHETFVEFNPMVADAIRMLSFQQVSYEILMSIRDPIARWLLKRLHLQISGTGEPLQQITAMEIQRNSGMSDWKAKRNLLRRITQSVETLETCGLIEILEAEEHIKNKRKSDITYTIQATQLFMDEIRYSAQLANENLRELSQEEGAEMDTSDFVPISAVRERAILNKRRTMKMNADEKVIDLKPHAKNSQLKLSDLKRSEA